MDRVRFCLVGTGRAGMVHGVNVTRRIKNAELVALVDANEKALKESGEPDEAADSLRLALARPFPEEQQARDLLQQLEGATN